MLTSRRLLINSRHTKNFSRPLLNRGMKPEYRKPLQKYQHSKSRFRYPMETNLREISLKVEAEFKFEHKDYRNAIESYKRLKSLADTRKDIISKLGAYRQIGICYKNLKQYKLALISFKKILQLAWFHNKIKWELLAYDYIGLVYYYLGDFERAKYYNDRMWKGICEPLDSDIRLISNNTLKIKEFKKNSDVKWNKDNSINYSDDEAQLPSPKSGAGTLDYAAQSLNHRNNKARQLKPFILLSHLSDNS